MNRYPRETVEFQPVAVTVNGQLVTDGVVFSVVRDGERPDIWSPATLLNGQIGVMIQDLVPGTYRIFAKVSANPESPVIDCGYFVVT